MRHGWIWSVLLALAIGMSAQPAWALTYQDKADKTITDSGQTRTVEGGTILQQSASDTDLRSADQVTCGTVPTDKNWHITRVAYNYVGTITNVRIGFLANDVTFNQDVVPVSNEARSFAVDVWLDEGQTLKLNPIGYTAGDDLYCWAFGIEYPDQ